MACLLRKSSPLSVRTKLRLYTAITRPIVTYASPAWYCFLSKGQKQRLKAFQHKCLRHLTASPWFVRNTTIRSSASIPLVEDFILGQAEELQKRAIASEWDHVRQIFLLPEPALPAVAYKRPRALVEGP